jgi:hypothetical protein
MSSLAKLRAAVEAKDVYLIGADDSVLPALLDRIDLLEAVVDALRRLVRAVDEFPGPYPDREEEIAALVQARRVLARLEQP